MKEIQGLIIKDLLQLKSYKRTLILFILIFLFIGITQDTLESAASVLITMLTLGLGMFSMATFSYDEMAKADTYIQTLPVTKKDIVKAKYVLVILSTVLGAILGSIFVLCILLFSTQGDLYRINLLEILSLALGSVFGIGIVESIQMPCFFKWGAEKGRIQMFILVVIIAFLFGGVLFWFDGMGIELGNIGGYGMFPFILMAITGVMYLISYRVSCKIYEKKEF